MFRLAFYFCRASRQLRFDALTLVPIFQAFWIVFSVLGGLVFFGEAENFDASSAIFFPLGVITVVASVYTLAAKGFEVEANQVESYQLPRLNTQGMNLHLVRCRALCCVPP